MALDKKVPPPQSSQASGEQKDVGQQATAPQTEQLSPEQIEAKLKELKQGFSRLGNKEKELEQKSKELEHFVKAYPELKAKAERAAQLEKMLAENPYEAVKQLGKNPADAYTKMAAGIMNDNPAMQGVQTLSKQIEKLQERLQKYEEADTKRQQETERQKFYEQLEKVAEEFPVIHSSKSYAVIEKMIEKLKADGEEPDLKKAAKLAEEGLREEIKKVIKAKSFTKEELLELLEEKLEEAQSNEPAKEKPKEAPKRLEPKVSSGAKKANPPSSGTEPSSIERPKTWEEARRRKKEIFRDILEKQTAQKR